MVTRCKFVHNLKCEEVCRHIIELHELVEDMLDYIEIHEAFGMPPTSERYEEFAQRADKLGIEASDD